MTTAGQRTGLLAAATAALAIFSALLAGLGAWLALTGPSAAPHPSEGAFGLWQSLVHVVAAILTLTWLSLGLRDVRTAGAVDLSAGPVGAVLWWFVPVANLVMPPKMVSELRKASMKPSDWQAVDGSALIGWWWTFWLVGGLANVVALRASLDADAEMQSILHPAATAADLLTIPAAILFAVIVLRIDTHLRALAPLSDQMSRPPARLRGR